MNRDELAAWSLSAAGGLLIGLAVLNGGVVGLAIAPLLVVAAMRLIQRMAALAGIIVGFGATVLAGGMLANAVCAGAGRAACVTAAGGGFILAFATIVLLVGVGLTLVALRSPPDRPGAGIG